MRVVPRRLLFFLLAAAGALAIAFLAEQLGFCEGINSYIYDMCFRIRGTRAVSERIVIIAIDEESLKELGRWPLPRRYYALMLDNLKKSSVTGFDILFTEPAADDPLLAESIRKHGRVVLPVYIDSNMHIEAPSSIIAPYKTGHVHIEQGVDGVARAIFHTIYCEDIPVPSLASVMYEAATGDHFVREAPSARTTKRIGGVKVLQQDLRKINYYGPAGRFHRISLADVVKGRYSQAFFEGKVVLVGLTTPGIIDEKSTPFSQYRNRMPGVEVFANAVNNLLDKGSIKDVASNVQVLCLIIYSLLFCVFCMRLTEKWVLFSWLFSLLLVSETIFLLFSRYNLWMSPSPFYLSFSVIFLLTYLYRLDSAARKLDSEHSVITSLLLSEAQKTVEPGLERGLFGFLSEKGITSKVEKLLQVERQYEHGLEEAVKQRTRELSEALFMISNLSNEMILRLTRAVENKDEGTGEHIVRVGLYAKQLAEALGMPPDFIDAISFASAMHDIGKLGIPDSILLKPGRLTDDEMEIMKTHCVIGERILADSPYPKIQMSAVIALNHHERWDGTGYPNRLKGEEVPIEARILIVCDCYDALRSKRHYKPALDHEKAFTIITEGDSRTMPEHFDPQVLRAFVESARVFEGIFRRHSS